MFYIKESISAILLYSCNSRPPKFTSAQSISSSVGLYKVNHSKDRNNKLEMRSSYESSKMFLNLWVLSWYLLEKFFQHLLNSTDYTKNIDSENLNQWIIFTNSSFPSFFTQFILLFECLMFPGILINIYLSFCSWAMIYRNSGVSAKFTSIIFLDYTWKLFTSYSVNVTDKAFLKFVQHYIFKTMLSARV